MFKKSGSTKFFISFIIAFLVLSQNSSFYAASKKKDSLPPAAPANLVAAVIGETSVTLKWTPSLSVKGNVTYSVYKDGVNIAFCKTESFTVIGLSAAASYQFYVRAKDQNGNLSSISNILTVTTAASVLPPPTSSVSPSSISSSSTVTSVPSSASSAVSSVPPASSVATSEISSVTSAVSSFVSVVSSAPVSPSFVPSVASSVPPISSIPTASSPAKIVVGYYASWSAYNGYTPADIPAKNLTHINYAFAKIGDDLKIALGDSYIDPVNFEKLHALKAANPHLKTLISVGGWTYSDQFSDAALTDSNRTAFADSVVAFIRQYNFDGVDIDWEYPVRGGLSTNTYRPEDKTNFTLLLQKLREKLNAQGLIDGKKYLLTIAGGAGNTYIKNTELRLIADCVDYAIIMTYDLHGPWDTYADFNAPLYTPSAPSPQYKLSADSCVRAWLAAGFPASKLVLGVPFYGYLYSGVTNADNGLCQPYTSGKSISYDNIVVGYLNNSAYIKYEDPDAKVPTLFNGSVFITYDDPTSVAEKANYVNLNNLAGVSVWELSQNKDGTLIHALNAALK